MVIEVIWCHIFSHGEVKWPPIVLKTLEGWILKSLPFIWYVQGWGAGKFFSNSASWLFSSGSGSGSWFFPQAAPAPAPGFFFKRLRLQGAKNTRLRPAPAPKPWICHMTWDTKKSLLWSWRSFCHGEFKWYPIGLKHWKVEYWSHYLSFDMSHDIGYKKVIVVVMEVIWGHVFGHGEVKWPALV